jgi:hypothetical protein
MDKECARRGSTTIDCMYPADGGEAYCWCEWGSPLVAPELSPIAPVSVKRSF